jgi:type III secretion system YscD/HrpQ family protein
MSETVIDINNHLSPEPRFVLRVLNGKQQGAEIALKAGRYKIGAEENCDIVLMGESIAPEHLDLFFAEGQTTLTQIHKKIYIDGQPLNPADLPLELEEKQIVMLGDTAITIGERNDAWPQLDEINDAVVETLALVKAHTPDSFLETIQRHLQDKQSFAKIGLSTGLILSVFFVLLTFSLHSTQKPQSIAAAAADRLAEQLATDPAYGNIRLIHSVPKKQLIGHVQRTAALNRLRAAATSSLVDINVVSIEKIDKSLNIISEIYGGNLSYKLIPSENRKVHLLLYGTIESSNQREAMYSLLKRDLSAITSIKIDVITQSEALEILNTWLNDYPNFAGLKAHQAEQGMLITGNLLGNFKQLWQEALIKSSPGLPQNMLPFIDVYFSPIFSGKIISFITGTKAQVRIFYKDSTTLASIGDKVRGGFSIKNITRDKIILSWRGRNFIYPLPK